MSINVSLEINNHMLYKRLDVWLINFSQLWMYMIIYIDHSGFFEIDNLQNSSIASPGPIRNRSLIPDRSGSLLWAELIQRMEAPLQHMDGGWRRIQKNTNVNFLRELRDSSPLGATFARFFCVSVAILNVFLPPTPLCSSFNGSASGAATSQTPSSPPPPPPPPLSPPAHRKTHVCSHKTPLLRTEFNSRKWMKNAKPAVLLGALTEAERASKIPQG